MTGDARVEDLLRELAPQVLGVLVRRYEDFAACENAVRPCISPPPAFTSSKQPSGWPTPTSTRPWTTPNTQPGGVWIELQPPDYEHTMRTLTAIIRDPELARSSVPMMCSMVDLPSRTGR